MATYTEEGQHLTLTKLKELTNYYDDTYNQYLEKISPDNRYKILAYPRPELHVTHVSHSTDRNGLQGIRGFKGFRGLRNPNYGGLQVVWFSLTVTPGDLREAETRNMKIVHPGGVEEKFRLMGAYGEWGGGYWDEEEEEGILPQFASSPAFLSSSRYGSYRFTFNLMDILEKYSHQFCYGQTPVMRMWKTELYEQEVMYAVLVHSPYDNYRFSHLPELEETPDSICAFRQGEEYFLWRPQAMCQKHSFKLVKSRGSLSVRELHHEEYFVWDHVTLALVVDDEVLQFSNKGLRRSLWFCDKGEPPVRPNVTFEPYYRANRAVRRLWPYSGNLWRFDDSDFHIV